MGPLKPRAVRDVLIVKFEARGDVLRTTSLLRPLHASGPCRISWLTSPGARPLLAQNPFLQKTFCLRLDRPLEVGSVTRRLAGRFDLVLSLEENRRAAQAAQAACRGELVGVRLSGGRLGYTPSSAPYYDMSLLNRGADGSPAGADALKAANRLSYSALWLKTLGLASTPGRSGPVLRLDDADRAAARRLARGPAFRRRGPVLALNPGSGARWPAKQLSEEKAARVLAALARRFGGPVLLLGGKDEAARNRRIAARLDASIRPIVPGSLPLRSFAAVLELCRVLATTDSLALHMAAALDRPAVALVGPTSAAELDFFGRGLALQPPGGCGCFYRPRCVRPGPCLDEIPDATIVAAVERCLTTRGGAAPAATY
jgi:ADP-heptose:LPS heptosyltransferase